MGSRKWLMVALVACGLATACQDYNTNLSVQTSSSVLTFLSPSQATVGSQGFTITANGTGFTTGAEILWNGIPLTTTLVSSIQLTAPVPASDLATTGVVQVAIEIPGSAQSPTQNVYATVTSAVSNVVLFTVSAAPGTPPTLTSMSPNSAPFCGNPSSFSQLTVTGTGFTSDSMVNWNGSPRATTMSSSTQLTATILATDASLPSPVAVTVSNSSGTSNALQFTISTPTANLAAPQPISSLAPASTFAGSPATVLVVTGNGSGAYLPCSVVKWTNSSGTTALSTQFVSASQLNATVPVADLQNAGTAQVTVFTPAPGGGTTASATFTITQPATPTVTSVTVSGGTATSTPACSTSNVTLQVTGANFVSGSVVNWNGAPLTNTTTFVSSTQLTAVVPFTETSISTAGTAAITVSNGSAVSNAVNFSITAPSSLPAPTVTAITPSSAMAGSTSPLTLNVTGTNFQPCSEILWNGSPLTLNPTYLNPTQLNATIPLADLKTVGPAQVTVSTPFGGGMSAAVNFAVSALTIDKAFVDGSPSQATSTPYCSASGFTLDVTAASGTTFTPDTVVKWNGSSRPTTFVSATELQAAITYADIAFPNQVSITVSNSASTSGQFSFGLTPPASLPVPSISSLLPPDAAVNGPAFTLSVNGSSMLACSTVQWNGAARITTFTSPNGLTASILATDINALGTEQVTVNTPAPSGCTASSTVTCGGTSNVALFKVHAPTAAMVLPAAAIEQSSGTGATAGSPRLLALHLMSLDQRYAVHVLASTDGVTEVAGSTQNIFVRDTCAGAASGCVPSETLASVGVGGNPADGNSFSPSISADGRYVAFLSSAWNLVDGDTNGVTDVFVRDTCAGAATGCTPSTQRVSVAGDGTQADGPSTSATISADGRYVTFESSASNLGSPSASSTAPGLFLRDTCAGAGAACVPSTVPLE